MRRKEAKEESTTEEFELRREVFSFDTAIFVDVHFEFATPPTNGHSPHQDFIHKKYEETVQEHVE